MEPTRDQILDELRQIEHAPQPDPAETLDQLVERKRREQGLPENNDQWLNSPSC